MNRRRRRTSRNPLVMLSLMIVVGIVCFAAGRMSVPSNDHDIANTDLMAETNKDLPETAAPLSSPTPNEELISRNIMEQAENIVAEMTLDEKIYQMIFTTPESLTGVSGVFQAGDATKAALQARPVGGIIYFAPNIQSREQIKTMIARSQEFSKLALFIGVDEEGGRVTRISSNPGMGYDKIPAMAQIGASGDSQKAYDTGKQLAKITGELGFNVDFAPVADIITNPNNTEIGDRSFGNDSELAADMVKQLVLGLQDSNICSVLKHFPGHGSTQANSHNGYSESRRTLDEMRGAEFPPFQAGIKAGADFVLISHMSAVNVDSSGKPASLSKTIVTDILKKELGFIGLVITDSLSMGAITNRYSAGEAAVMAVEAGVDVLLIPASLSSAFSGVKNAVSSGRISEERIDESVMKIISLKLRRSIIK